MPIRPAVKVTAVNGSAVSGTSVTFAVTSGAGSVTGSTATSGADGVATVGGWTLGTVAGANTLTATATGLSGSPITFTATGVAGAASAVAVHAGDNQTATAGSAVAIRPGVRFTDVNGNAVSGTTVTFAVVSGGGSVTGGAVTSGADGVATIGDWTLGTTAGPNTLTATATGLSGSPVTLGLTRFRGRLTRPKFGAEVAHEVQQESRAA